MTNPRRTPAASRDGSGPALGLKTNLALRKGATFHSPTSPSSEAACPAFRPPSLPRRSQTNLDDVIDAHRRRIRMTLETIDLALSAASESQSQDVAASKTPIDKSFPFPDSVQKHSVAMLDEPGKERRVLRPRSTLRRPTRQHNSDSGLGSSIVTSKEKITVEASSNKDHTSSVKASSVTRSAAASTAALPGLSARATSKICEHILKPLLSKPQLKPFHPLVIDCPRRIQEKEVLCLRDLEKTLLLIAPETTKSRELYLDFCLSTVRCIQATVEYLTDHEQTRPRDPVYTNGYFIDLVDQIQLYAKQLSEVKDKNTATGDEMELDAADAIKLHGGIHINGRPAELVRVNKNGKAFSLATGLEVDMDQEANGDIKIKRSASEELADEDEIMRSMARRKKNASPEELAPKRCREPGCNKEFKRPCDLTKHEKTHSRPWKCPVETCKYHDYGWPTEKEMDRHCNDKHNTAPPMYKCLYPPCPYKSKRESNCKQHMEKAHGWQYVRTKTNGGKKTSSKAGSVTHQTPSMRGLPTPISNPPSIGMATPPREPLGFPAHSIEFPAYIPEATPFDFNTLPQEIHIDAMDHLSYSPEYSPPADNPTPLTDPGLDASSVIFQDPTAANNYHWDDIYSANQVQLQGPNFPRELAENFVAFSEAEFSKVQMPHISPSGQGNSMLYTPHSMAEVDDSFDNVAIADIRGGADFMLFPPTEGKGLFQTSPLFCNEMPSVAAGYSQPNSQELWGVDWSSNLNGMHYSQHH
ncbi:hypothetical protein BD289DRAFT_459903 [Coniella lustricola]|uniref:C2H2-type domain-containing protein n=1 Tax=Coniella lustricola TaxID=2025994 RepID=A0A2T3ACF3_9PEZI|nr:hypothetical protein BD289DRAFT_459903 [Coniella lustricola]